MGEHAASPPGPSVGASPPGGATVANPIGPVAGRTATTDRGATPDPGAAADAPGRLRRHVLRGGDPLVVPGVTDGIGAALARAAGFSTVYVSGAGTAAARGLPDMSVLSLGELVDAVRVLGGQGVDTVVDLDTGYGGLVTLRRAMRDLAAAGAAAVHLEDQPFPRKCGYLTSEPCVEVDVMRQRLDAARGAGVDLVVIARTDALLVSGLDDALSRAVAYQEAGAEMVFVNGLRSLDELRRVRQAVSVPLVYNVSGSDRSPWLSRREAGELGVAMVLHPIQAARAAARAVERYLEALAADVPAASADLLDFGRYMDLAGWADAETFERAVGRSSGESPHERGRVRP